MTNHFALIGEHKTEPGRLLVLGEDGQYYVWELEDDLILPVEVDAEWRLDPVPPEPETVLLEP